MPGAASVGAVQADRAVVGRRSPHVAEHPAVRAQTQREPMLPHQVRHSTIGVHTEPRERRQLHV